MVVLFFIRFRDEERAFRSAIKRIALVARFRRSSRSRVERNWRTRVSVCLCQFSVCSVLCFLIVLLIILSAGLSLFPSSLYLLVRTYLFITIDLLLSTVRLTLVPAVHRPSSTIDRFGIVERPSDRAGPTVSIAMRLLTLNSRCP